MLQSVIGGAAIAVAVGALLAWKWQLGVVRTSLVLVAFALPAALAGDLLAGAVAIPSGFRVAVVAFLALLGATALLAYRFYRDPERAAPARDDIVVSPADGEVIYVRESRNNTVPRSTKLGRDYLLKELTKTPLEDGDAVVVGIAMNFADVHVNRAPIAGEIVLRRHFPGRFGSLRRSEAVLENERTTTVIRGRGLEVAVVQIASRLVRQIVSFVDEGERVTLGQRIGVIRLGSQVDLVLPARSVTTLAVDVGDRLRAGESIVAELRSPTPSRGTARPLAHAERSHS
jgi:phosphatidylserine decarboxylase